MDNIDTYLHINCIIIHRVTLNKCICVLLRKYICKENKINTSPQNFKYKLNNNNFFST